MLALCPFCSLRAEKAPLSPEKLAEQADLIIVGEVLALKITHERSQIETGSGNYDWIIESSIKVREVEKGTAQVGDTIGARSFRIKSRKSATGFMSPSGHHPIPKVGSITRVHLKSDFSVLLPNGFTSTDPRRELSSAVEVNALQSGYTYGLPMGGWILLILVLVSLVVFVILLRQTQRKERTKVHARRSKPHTSDRR